MEPTQYEPIATLGQLGDYKGVPFFGSYRGSGIDTVTYGVFSLLYHKIDLAGVVHVNRNHTNLGYFFGGEG